MAMFLARIFHKSKKDLTLTVGIVERKQKVSMHTDVLILLKKILACTLCKELWEYQNFVWDK